MIERAFPAGVTVAAMLGALGCSAEPASEADTAHLATVSQEIGGGSPVTSNSFNVAVFIFGNDWVWHICSGAIVGVSNGLAYVATAHHCAGLAPVPADPAFFRLTTEKTPGRPLIPPASWVTPTAVYFPNNAGPGSTDFAIIVVPNNTAFRAGLTPSLSNNGLGLFLGNPADQVGRVMSGYGYGSNWQIPPASGFGVLRKVDNLTIMPESGPGYINWDSNPAGTGSGWIGDGDSGGPSTRLFSYQDSSGTARVWTILLGVHSESVWDVGFEVASPMIPQFLQTTIGRLFAKPFAAPTRYLRRSSEVSGSAVNASSTLSDGPSMWYYSFSSKRLSLGSVCMQGSSTENSAVTVVTCSSSSNQQWIHTKDLQLKNVGSGKCAAYSSGNVVNRTCSAVAEQAWAFRGF